jgi:hypothetical protein
MVSVFGFVGAGFFDFAESVSKLVRWRRRRSTLLNRQSATIATDRAADFDTKRRRRSAIKIGRYGRWARRPNPCFIQTSSTQQNLTMQQVNQVTTRKIVSKSIQIIQWKLRHLMFSLDNPVGD